MNRALLVGINAYPTAPLFGCVNDIQDLSNFLVSKCSFNMADIRLLVDDRATQAAIVDRLNWLVSGLNPGDRVLFYYSGHGAQMALRDAQGNVNVLHDVICPVDFDWTPGHAISDSDFSNVFNTVPAGVEFIWGSDSCHSGDLTKSFLKINCRHKFLIPPVDLQWRIKIANQANLRSIPLLSNTTLNLALMAACQSDQTASDASFDGRPNGAFTYYLLNELEKSTGLTTAINTVIPAISNDLQSNGYNQNPQLRGSAIVQQKPFLA